jgi:hypothetical protein
MCNNLKIEMDHRSPQSIPIVPSPTPTTPSIRARTPARPAGCSTGTIRGGAARVPVHRNNPRRGPLGVGYDAASIGIDVQVNQEPPVGLCETSLRDILHPAPPHPRWFWSARRPPAPRGATRSSPLPRGGDRHGPRVPGGRRLSGRNAGMCGGSDESRTRTPNGLPVSLPPPPRWVAPGSRGGRWTQAGRAFAAAGGGRSAEATASTAGVGGGRPVRRGRDAGLPRGDPRPFRPAAAVAAEMERERPGPAVWAACGWACGVLTECG